jgi:hypothetical protein
VVGALYGLKQAGRLWYQKLVNILVDYGFIRNIYDPCIFYLNKDAETIKVACHVDDLLIISDSTESQRKFIAHLEKNVNKVKIFTEDITYLGVELKRDRVKKGDYLKTRKICERLNTRIIGYPYRIIKVSPIKIKFRI